MFDQADLVVIAHPSVTKDAPEKKTPPDRLPMGGVVAQETEFKIALATKGDKNLTQLVLHHYRLGKPEGLVINGPHFVSFNSKETHQSYLLFLKKEADGRYAPVCGQYDPALFSVLKLEGMAR